VSMGEPPWGYREWQSREAPTPTNAPNRGAWPSQRLLVRAAVRAPRRTPPQRQKALRPCGGRFVSAVDPPLAKRAEPRHLAVVASAVSLARRAAGRGPRARGLRRQQRRSRRVPLAEQRTERRRLAADAGSQRCCATVVATRRAAGHRRPGGRPALQACLGRDQRR